MMRVRMSGPKESGSLTGKGSVRPITESSAIARCELASVSRIGALPCNARADPDFAARARIGRSRSASSALKAASSAGDFC